MKFVLPVSVGILLLTGCAAPLPQSEEEPPTASPPQEAASLRPDNLLFPDYLLMEGFEIGQHGRIPEHTLVGAEMTTELDLPDTLHRFTAVLNASGWEIVQQELAAQSFRLIAVLNSAKVEIRGVQGAGVTQVFLLYFPEPKTDS